MVPEPPEPALLATMLLAVESDRRDILNRVAAGFEEEIEAVAPLYWPFLIVHGEGSPGAAVFDLTGVWKRSFQYASMPPAEKLRSVLDGHLAPEEFLARMRALAQSFASNQGTEALTVEGFLTLDPALQLDLLAQASGPAGAPSPRAGFLPSRHRVEWYEQEVERMRQWLARLDGDLASLREFRGQAEAAVRSAQARLELAGAKTETEGRELVAEAQQHAHREIAKIQQARHAEVLQHLNGIERAHHTVAYGETAISTATTLADRAVSRRDDPRPHHLRAREARTAIRNARHQIRESRRAIEEIHQRQRDAQEEALAAVAQIERSSAMGLAHHELLGDHFLSGAADLLAAVDGQIASRQAQKEAMARNFLPLPSAAATKIVWLPIWAATLRSPRGVRQIVFPPLKVRDSVGVGGSLKRLFGGMVLPFEPRTVPFDKEFRSTIEQALSADAWLANVTQELTRSADVLTSPTILGRFEEGLLELKRKGWISQKQASDFLRAYRELADRRKSKPTLPPGEATDTNGAGEHPTLEVDLAGLVPGPTPA